MGTSWTVVAEDTTDEWTKTDDFTVADQRAWKQVAGDVPAAGFLSVHDGIEVLNINPEDMCLEPENIQADRDAWVKVEDPT